MTDELIDRQLGLYEIVTRLGSGGMASVYKAYQRSVDRYVALKVLPRHYTPGHEISRERFLQEAQVVAKLEHPHILPVYDFGESEGYLYLVMRLVEGGTLFDRFHGQPFPLELIRQIIIQIGDALDYAHHEGVIHRDIKLHNILMDQRDNCMLTDFGIAKVLQQGAINLTQVGTTVGTPTYMSPEQIQGDALDGRSDIYSLGVILFQLATGHPPYDAETPREISTKHLYAPVPSARALNPMLPPLLEEIIARAMAKERQERYATAGEMVQAMKQASFEQTDALVDVSTEGDGDRTGMLAIEEETTTLPLEEIADILSPSISDDGGSPLIADKRVRSESLSGGEGIEAVLIDTPDPQAPVTNAVNIPGSISVPPPQGSAQTPLAGDAPDVVAGPSPSTSVWRGKTLIIFGLMAAVIIALSGILIGILLSSDRSISPDEMITVLLSFVPISGSASSEQPLPVDDDRLLLQDDFSEKRLAEGITDGVWTKYEQDRYIIVVDPIAAASEKTEKTAGVFTLPVGNQIYEDFILEIEVAELSSFRNDEVQVSGRPTSDSSERGVESSSKDQGLAAEPNRSEKTRYGVILRNQGNSYYELVISSDGAFTFAKVLANEEIFAFSGQSETVKNRAKDRKPSQMHIEAVGPEFAIFINDEKLKTVTDPDDVYLKQGEVGLLVDAIGEEGAHVAFDNLKIWSLME